MVAMTDEAELQKRVDKLRHLMAEEDQGNDFVLPSVLKEVPSYTSIDTMPLEYGGKGGELRGHPQRNPDRAA